jgi:hypothetical protein
VFPPTLLGAAVPAALREGWALSASFYGRSAFAVLLAMLPRVAWAVPSFAEQTGQPCAACHVGAFGPQLRQFGRDFKLGGYTADDGSSHFPPVAATVYGSFTRTQQPQAGGAARWFAANDNAALDQVSLYYAGLISRHVGAFAQVTYDGVARQLQIDNLDLRYARERHILGVDTQWGLTLNNSPTVSDLWNSTPVWGFPYNQSGLAPVPVAATLIDGGLGQQVVGFGGYALWDRWVYTEADIYEGLSRGFRNAVGTVPVSGVPSLANAAPYWRVALQHDWGRSYGEVGAYGIVARLAGDEAGMPGPAERIRDVAVDANWQFVFDPRWVTGDVISAHATVIGESQDWGGSAGGYRARPQDRLTTMRVDVSYSIGATYTPTVSLFQTSGTSDPALWGTPGGNPGSAGYIAEIAYVPFGKPKSFIGWGNLRLALQYVGYWQFDGQSRGASANNNVYASLWLAWHF